MRHLYTIGKNERLKGKKIIQDLFKDGKSLNFPLFRVVYAVREGGASLRAGFSVGKKRFKKATDRNRIRRLIREAWRLQSIPLKEKLKSGEKSMDVFLIFTGNQVPPYSLVATSVAELLRKLSDARVLVLNKPNKPDEHTSV